MGKRFLSFLVVCLCAVNVAFAQQKITGTVVDAETGEPVIGASVLVKGTNIGAATDVKGNFVITNAPKNSRTLRVSYIGMKTKEVAVRTNNMRVLLESEAKALQETLVVAYGTATKETFTGAASQLKGEVIENRQISNISNALAGNVAGVTAIKNNGQPGTSSTIRIRGFGSINADMNPLYVLDGMPYDGDISEINPNDVESMSVLKDAAAAALYGARGANGVIMITTKKGQKAQDAQVSLEASWGSNSRQIKNYNVIDNTATYYEQMYRSRYNNGMYYLGYTPDQAHEYAAGLAETATGYKIYNVPQGQSLFTADGKLNPLATLGYSDGEYTYRPDDWNKEQFRNGLRQEYNLTVKGGTDKISYYLGAGYLDDQGVVIGSSYRRISTRANVEYQAKKWLKFTANISYNNSASNQAAESTTDRSSGNAFFMANNLAPVYPLYARDANGLIMMNGKTPVYDYGDGTTGNFTRNYMSMANPLGALTYSTEEYLLDIFNSRWGVEITPVKGLTLSARLGINLDNTRFHMASSPLYGQSASYGGEAIQANTRVFAATQQYLANYRNTFAEEHTLDVLAGYETYDYTYEEAEAYGQNLYKPGDWTVNNTIDQRRGYGYVDKYATRSIIGRANYDYAERYFVSASIRRDGSSRFAKKWGTFWSASAAWNIGREAFMESASWVDLLKLRASFGQQGNDNIRNYYAYADQYTMKGAEGVFSDGTLAYKGNPDLTWEKSNAWDVAVDFDFWGGRLYGSIDYYNRTTQDMLYKKPVASSNGYSFIPMNIGSMRNHGVEVDLHSDVFKTKNFTWTIDFNINHNINKILKLAPELNGEMIDGSSIYQEGKSIYQYYFVKYAGVDPTTGQALYWAKDKNDVEYATTEYNVARSTNRCATGNLQPTANGGVGTTLKFYGVDFSIQCNYQFGGRCYDSSYQNLMHNIDATSAGRAVHKDMLNAWTPENTATNVPRMCTDDLYSNAMSDRFLVSSNYFGINNITIGYTLPQSVTRRIFIDSIRLYGSADNVALFSARKGLDPRVGIGSADNYMYSALRTISGGIKVTF